VYVGFLPQQFIAPVDGAAPREAAVEVAVLGEIVLLHLAVGSVRYAVLFVDFCLLCVRVLRIWS